MGHALNGSIQDALIALRTACEGGGRSGSSAPTTPASPPSARSRSSSSARARRARSSGARRSSSACGSWREQYGGQIIEQFKRLGASLRLRRRALHAGRRPTSRAVLRGLRRALRAGPDLPRQLHGQLGPGLRSAISDLEVEQREGVTRHAVRDRLSAERRRARSWSPRCGPETMLADTAVAVHPDDDRYRHLVGTHRDRCRSSGASCRSSPTSTSRPRLRHRRAEDHARPRPQRLRDRPRATASRRSRVIGEDGRMTETAGELRRADGARGAASGRRGARGRRPIVAREPYVHDRARLATARASASSR